MEFDLLKVLEYGISTALCLILIFRVNPALNGLKDITKELVTAVQVDSTNINNMKSAIDMNITQTAALTTQVATFAGAIGNDLTHALERNTEVTKEDAESGKRMEKAIGELCSKITEFMEKK
jgi:hypothetical protein